MYRVLCPAAPVNKIYRDELLRIPPQSENRKASSNVVVILLYKSGFVTEIRWPFVKRRICCVSGTWVKMMVWVDL